MANLTIVVDEEVLKRARLRAIESGTSVNAVLREHLERYAGVVDTRQATLALLEFAAANPGHSGGWKWNREEIYEERLGRYGRK